MVRQTKRGCSGVCCFVCGGAALVPIGEYFALFPSPCVEVRAGSHLVAHGSGFFGVEPVENIQTVCRIMLLILRAVLGDT